ncbi:hypothetical protein BCR34DRAFT_588841 [Clohesyomyces aquaticus]|uniref:Uncharacterized protein n=1 Tax=Clohesyomyces aquaticus TaxID=1231657 RepID=A0A1Y1ZJC3_9PLEO|nr:hypothetical protein BCR34DRAFT_588841 [Clohesyomyces aquaticus]
MKPRLETTREETSLFTTPTKSLKFKFLHNGAEAPYPKHDPPLSLSSSMFTDEMGQQSAVSESYDCLDNDEFEEDTRLGIVVIFIENNYFQNYVPRSNWYGNLSGGELYSGRTGLSKSPVGVRAMRRITIQCNEAWLQRDEGEVTCIARVKPNRTTTSVDLPILMNWFLRWLLLA